MTIAIPKATCRSCHEPIIWALSLTGKRMPVDVEPTETGNLILSSHRPDPIVTVASKTGRYSGQKLYRSHFATCPRVERHRKRISAPARPSVPAGQGELFGGSR